MQEYIDAVRPLIELLTNPAPDQDGTIRPPPPPSRGDGPNGPRQPTEARIVISFDDPSKEELFDDIIQHITAPVMAQNRTLRVAGKSSERTDDGTLYMAARFLGVPSALHAVVEAARNYAAPKGTRVYARVNHNMEDFFGDDE